MIRIENRRFNGVDCEPIMREVGVDRALESLAVHELGFGGQVVDIAVNKVKVVTDGPGFQDTTYFTGTAEEMRPLVELAAYTGRFQDEHSDLLAEAVAKKLSTMKDGGKPLIAVTYGRLLHGQFSIKGALLYGMGVEKPPNAESLARISVGDLIAAIRLAQECNVTVQEVIDDFYPPKKEAVAV